MAPQWKFLDEIDTTTKNFKVKVRVAEKGRPQTSEKNTRYQLRNLDAQWRAKEDDIPFHLSIGSNTVIRSLDPKGESIYPKYQTLASILSIPIDDDRHEEPRRIVTSSNKETSVLDLMVIDHREAFNPTAERIVTTIGCLKARKSASTLPQEVFWLNVVIADIEFERLRAYIGCSHCGKRTDLSLGTVYSCKACSRKDIHAAYRTTVTFNVSDGTGSLELTAFTADTKETPHKDDLIDSSQEEEDACVFAESLIAASDNNQDSVEDFSQKRNRSGNEAELDFHTPTKEASLGAKEGKDIGSEEQVNSEFKLRKVKQERVTRRRTLILQDDDEEDSWNHATTLTKDQVSSSFNKY
uniref:Replication factor A C-terminal domain-containing protein n=1 Tax=Chenopodium quinoa TaxID=63459 RepID=A0A803MQU1_CHEQI